MLHSKFIKTMLALLSAASFLGAPLPAWAAPSIASTTATSSLFATSSTPIATSTSATSTSSDTTNATSSNFLLPILTVSKSTTSASVVEKVPKNKKEVMPRNAAATSTVSAFSGALSSSELPIDETALTVYTQSDALTPQQTRGFYILAGLFAAVGVLLIEGHLLDLLYAFLVRLIGIPPKEKPARIHTGTASLHT